MCPTQLTVNIWGLPLVCVGGVNGLYLTVSIPKTRGWTPTSVRTSSSATFDLIRIDVDSTVVQGDTAITNVSLSRASDTYVIIAIYVNKPLVDAAIYRVGWSIPNMIIA